MMKIRFPIGDWSKDGHNQCEWYFATTELTVQEVREAHFMCSEIYGFDIGDICTEHEEDQINEDIVDVLKRYNLIDEHFENEDIDSEQIFLILLGILNSIYPALKLAPFTNKKDYEDINFYGRDVKNRHINTPGYGIFLD